MAMTRKQMLEFEAEQRKKRGNPLYRRGVGGREETVTTATRADAEAAQRALQTDVPISPIRAQGVPVPPYRTQDTLEGTRDLPTNTRGGGTIRPVKNAFQQRGIGNTPPAARVATSPGQLDDRFQQRLGYDVPEQPTFADRIISYAKGVHNQITQPTPRANTAVNLATGSREAPPNTPEGNAPQGTLALGDLRNMRGVGAAPPAVETIVTDLNEGKPTEYASRNNDYDQPLGSAARAAQGSDQAVTGTQTLRGRTYQTLEDGSLYLDAEGVEPIASSGIQPWNGTLRGGGTAGGGNPGFSSTTTGRRLPGQRAGENGFAINRTSPFQSASNAAIAPFAAAKRAQMQGGAARGANILRNINRIHDAADKRYEQVRQQTGSSRAAERAANAIRSRADSLLSADRTDTVRQGDQLSADSYNRRTEADLVARRESARMNMLAEQGTAARTELEGFIETAAQSIIPEGLKETADVDRALADATLRITANLPDNWGTLGKQGKAEAMQDAAADAGFLSELSREAGVSYYSMGDLLSPSNAVSGGKLKQRDVRFWRALFEEGPLDAIVREFSGAGEIQLPGTSNEMSVGEIVGLYRMNRRARTDTFNPVEDDF